MEICLVAVNFFKRTGEGRVNYEIASEAIRRHHRVTLVARNVDAKLASSELVTWIKLPSKLPTQILSFIDFSYRATKWLRQHQDEFNLVHVSDARLWMGADIFTCHFWFDTWSRSPFHPWQIKKTPSSLYQLTVAKWFSRWQKKLFPLAFSLVAVSETLRQETIASGIDRNKISVINNGVELEEFYPGIADRKSLGLPENVTLALFVGDIKLPRKNLETLLRALQPLPTVHLAVAGHLKRSPYPKLAQELGIGDRVHFLDYRRDVAEIMRGVDLFVVPSRYDTFGLVVIEAMASGLPVITTEAMGVSALVTPESGIVLSDTEDISALTKAIATITANPAIAKQMGQAGVAIAQNHSWKNTASEYLDLFERQYRDKQSFSKSKLLEVN